MVLVWELLIGLCVAINRFSLETVNIEIMAKLGNIVLQKWHVVAGLVEQIEKLIAQSKTGIVIKQSRIPNNVTRARTGHRNS